MSVKARVAINSLALPTAVEIGTQQTVGISVDNYSGYWLELGSENMFVPPYVLGWASNFSGSIAGGINIRKNTPVAAFTNPIAGTEDDSVIITAYDTPVAPNPGLPILTKPVQTRSFVQFNAPAGDTVFSVIANSLRFLTVNLSGIVTVGTIGVITFNITDGIGGNVNLLDLIVGAAQPSSLAQSFGSIPPGLSTVPPVTWSLHLVRTDMVGANQFWSAVDVAFQ